MAGISFDFRQQGNPEETRQLIKSLRQQTQAAGLYFPDTPVDLQTAITFAKPFLEKQAEQSNQQLLQQKQGDIASGQARGLTEVALPGLQGALEKFHPPEVVNRAMGSIPSSGGPSGTGAFSPLGPEAGQLTLARALAASKTPISEPGYTAALTQKPTKPTKEDSLIGKIDPSKYTTNSVRKFAATGDYGVLELVEKPKENKSALDEKDILKQANTNYQAYLKSLEIGESPTLNLNDFIEIARQQIEKVKNPEGRKVSERTVTDEQFKGGNTPMNIQERKTLTDNQGKQKNYVKINDQWYEE